MTTGRDSNGLSEPAGALSRRVVFRHAARGSAALTLAAGLGCSANRGSKSSVSQAGVARHGGTLRRRSVTNAYEGGFDPHIQAGSQTGEMGLFYQGLVQLNPATIAIEPQLAQKFEQPSQLEYVFRLQPGVKWHDKAPVNGRLMTADDVVSSLERLRTNDPRFINRSLLDSIDKIQAVDDATVRMTARLPDASIMNNLASFSAAVLAPEVVAKNDKFANPEDAVGTGAFTLQSRDDTGAILVRNQDYWKAGLPYLDGIRNAVFKDDESAWAAFLVGQLDTNYVPGTEAQKIFAEQANKYHLSWFSDVAWVGLQANLKKKPFDDARVTRGMRLLVDHDEALTAWANVYLGRGRLSSALPAALDSWDFTEDEYRSKFLEFKRPKDDAIKQSLTLLSAAGFSKDNPLKFVLSGLTGPLAFTTAQSELMQAQFNQESQGVLKADLRLLDEPHQREAVTSHDFEYVITNLVPGQPYEVDSWLRTFYYSSGSRNYGSYSDPALDEMIDKQRGIFDLGQRKAMVKDILTYMINNAPYTSWSSRYNPNAAQFKVQNFAPEGNSAIWGAHYEQMWLHA
jgi:peptide/nickel transport system substrate-binding protein